MDNAYVRHRLQKTSGDFFPSIIHSLYCRQYPRVLWRGFMNIRTKVMLAIMLAVALSIIGVTVMVSHEMNKAFINNFQISSKAQLDRMNAFADNFFEASISTANFFVESPLVQNNIDNLTSYIDRKEDHTPKGADLPDGERALYDELLRLTQNSLYALAYVGNSKGGFTRLQDDRLSPGYNPAQRPWYTDAVKARKALLTEAYISDSAQGGAVCTVAAPIPAPGGSGFAGVVGFDINLDTLTNETGTVTVGKTGYVLMMDSLGQIIQRSPALGEEIPEDKRWLGKNVKELPAEANKTPYGRQGGRTGSDPGRRTWLASAQSTKDNWTLIMLQEKNEVFADAMSVTLSIFMVGLVIIVIMIAVAFVVARSIAGPVAVLASASQAVAGGDMKAIPRMNACSGESSDCSTAAQTNGFQTGGVDRHRQRQDEGSRGRPFPFPCLPGRSRGSQKTGRTRAPGRRATDGGTNRRGARQAFRGHETSVRRSRQYRTPHGRTA